MVPEERAEWFHVGSLTHGESKGLEEGGLGGIDAALGLVDVEKVGIDAAHHDGIVKHLLRGVLPVSRPSAPALRGALQ